MSFMNLIMGFFGVPWLFFLRNNLGYVFPAFCFWVPFFFSVFPFLKTWLVIWFGGLAVEVVYKLFLVFILGPSCVLVLYGFFFQFCCSRCLNSLR